MNRIGSDELMEQMVFDEIEPLPDPYWCAAMIAYVVSSVNHVKGPRPRFEDYFPRKARAKPAKRFTPEEFDRRFGARPALPAPAPGPAPDAQVEVKVRYRATPVT
jgi:hypothetical protein